MNFINRALVAAIENVNIQEQAVQRRAVFLPLDPFEVSDRMFIKNFRLTKDLVQDLINELEPHAPQQTRISSLSLRSKLLIALNFYATGSYQTPVGQSLFLGVSRASVSRSVQKITDILNRPEVFNHWVAFPQNIEQLQELRQRFFNNFHMPGVIGCIDCTHVAIVPPPRDDPQRPEHVFVNRKHYHSINTELICDSDLRIYHVNSRFPGSTHDTHIFNSSNVLPFLRSIYNTFGEAYFLLGDSGYLLRPWLLTPLQNPQGEAEENYNTRHKIIRSIIERVNGILKMRFLCLLKDRTLHYSPQKASHIIKACVVLHNICIMNNVELIDDDLQDNNFDFGQIAQPILNENAGRQNPELMAGRRVQRRLINQLHH